MPPQVIDRWRIIRSLGEGGQAHTYLVVETSGPVGDEAIQYVLKRLKNPERAGRFEREVSALIDLNHPNVLKILDVGTDGDKPYFVGEYCAGGDLETAFERVVRSPDDALRIFGEVSEGAGAAHETGIVHRDIKPANVFLRDLHGPAVLGDFGLAWSEAATPITAASEAVGPRLFMAPELEDGRLETVTPAADIYSLGKLLYWLLSGGRVFSREKHRLAGHNLVEITGNPRMEHVNRLLDRMISPDPRQRIASAAGLATQVRNMRKILAGNFNVVGSDVPQPCTYCGLGEYRTVAEGAGVRDFGITAYSGHDWRVLVCTMCGHVQLFRVDLGTWAAWHYSPDW